MLVFGQTHNKYPTLWYNFVYLLALKMNYKRIASRLFIPFSCTESVEHLKVIFRNNSFTTKYPHFNRSDYVTLSSDVTGIVEAHKRPQLFLADVPIPERDYVVCSAFFRVSTSPHCSLLTHPSRI